MKQSNNKENESKREKSSIGKWGVIDG